MRTAAATPPPSSHAPQPNRQKWIALAVTAVLLALFVLMSFSASRTKSATWDEPGHAFNAYVIRHFGDYRFSPESPAGFAWLMSMALQRDDLHIDPADPRYRNVANDTDRWAYVIHALYADPASRP